MPCYSRIQTKMNIAENLGAALAALGWKANVTNHTITADKDGRTIEFTRYDKSDAFSVRGDTSSLAAISRKYAEVGVRAWATKNRFNVAETDGVEMTLVRRSF